MILRTYFDIVLIWNKFHKYVLFLSLIIALYLYLSPTRADGQRIIPVVSVAMNTSGAAKIGARFTGKSGQGATSAEKCLELDVAM